MVHSTTQWRGSTVRQLPSTTRSSFLLKIQERPRNATSITKPKPETGDTDYVEVPLKYAHSKDKQVATGEPASRNVSGVPSALTTTPSTGLPGAS